jgi:hypothetical protein
MIRFLSNHPNSPLPRSRRFCECSIQAEEPVQSLWKKTKRGSREAKEKQPKSAATKQMGALGAERKVSKRNVSRGRSRAAA